MTIPPRNVNQYLEPNAPVAVRTADYGCFNSALPYQEAIALAARGEVEAVVTKGGKVRYLRLLAEKERPARLEIEEIPAEEFTRGRKGPSSSVIAQTNMGVYREPVCSVKTDEYGLPERTVVAHVWSFCALRGRT